jgi:serine protease Do
MAAFALCATAGQGGFPMKNVRFGVFCLGLAIAVVGVVSSLNAQARFQVAPPGRNVMVLDGRGAELGVMVSDVDSRTTGGVKVDEVHQDSAGEKAGIKSGDVIVEFDGEKVRSARQFARLVQETPEGRSVAIALMRDGKRQTVTATPEASTMTWNIRREPGAGSREPGSREPREFEFRAMPDFNFDFNDRLPRNFEYRLPDGFRMPVPGSPLPTSRGRLGITVQSITPELEEYFGATKGGALVSSVIKESAAAKAGIKAGDVIVSINGKHVADSDALIRDLDDVDGDATIVVVRDKKEMTLKATLERRMPRPSVRG